MLWLVIGLLAPAGSSWAKLDAEEIEIKVALAAAAPEMFRTLERWVALNTGTWNLEGLERFARLLEDALAGLGFEVALEPGRPLAIPGREEARTGPIVLARRERPDAAGLPRLLLVGHYDTVFEPESDFQELRVPPGDSGRSVGPGAADMKGGLVVMLFALRALAETGDLDRAHWTVLLNADEEVGSLVSREHIEARAREAEYGFVFEAARPNGAMVRSRRGLGQFHLRIRGLAAHAGDAHSRGRSAVRELAEKVLRIEAMTDYAAGLTFNVGRVRGGTKRNVVPEHAEAWIDLRYDDPEQGEQARAALEALVAQAVVEGTRTELWGRLHRPPKLDTAETRRLLALHREVAEDLGLESPPAVHAAGGTDGSLMAAVGLATLDSMGVRGGDSHTDREYVLLESLAERAALAAILMRRVALLYDPQPSE